MDSIFLNAIFYDKKGYIYSDERFFAAGRYFNLFIPLTLNELIPIPDDTILFHLPQRYPVVFDKNIQPLLLKDRIPVAAFIPPGYTQTLLCSYIKNREKNITLPLFSYTAVGSYKNKLYVAAIHIDKDKRHKISAFSDEIIYKNGEKLIKQFSKNRLIKHLVEMCAVKYRCPNARNFIMKRFEAPLPVSPKCNSRCLGCISYQKESSGVKSSQERLNFVPTEEELYEISEYHIKNVKRPILSFGQGCEGEPLLESELIAKVIKRIKRKFKQVTININTNGSRPYFLKYLFECGLDSARISLNSVQENLYIEYYKPIDYSFSDVNKSISLGKKLNKWISLNYFVFPGITDSEEEFEQFLKLLKRHSPSMIQFRNFNIDPDWYIESMNIRKPSKVLGIKNIINYIKKEFPHIRLGYFNPYIKK